MKIQDIKFNSDGLVPVIAACASSNRVLMLAYMNKDAVDATIKTRYAHYYSRSRRTLWKKGETSGNVQEVAEIILDCDKDTILLKVNQKGPACHTNEPSCFFDTLKQFSKKPNIGVLVDIENTIKERKKKPEKGSYTNYLLEKGKEKICKKIAEEAGEVVIASIKNDKTELAKECADLLFHMQMLLEVEGMSLSNVLEVLEERRAKERERSYLLANL